jgi:hypothetical protein
MRLARHGLNFFAEAASATDIAIVNACENIAVVYFVMRNLTGSF